MTNNREYVEINGKEMRLLADILGLIVNKCYYCNKKIRKKDKFALFNKPVRIICNSEFCLMKGIDDDEK